MATPVAGLVTVTAPTPGQALDCIAPNQAGGYIVNPLDPADQGLGVAAVLYVDQVGPAGTEAHGTTLALAPGGAYTVIPFTTTAVSVASNSPNHRFTAVMWPDA